MMLSKFLVPGTAVPVNMETTAELCRELRSAADIIEQQAAEIEALKHDMTEVMQISRDVATESEDVRADAERYRGIKARHAYSLVTRMLGRDGYSSAAARRLIDEWADAATSEVHAYAALSEEQKRDNWKSDLDKTIKSQTSACTQSAVAAPSWSNGAG